MTTIYKITFFRLDIASGDWLSFFQTLFSVTASFKFTVLRNGRKVDFYVSSDKRLDLLNTKLTPFFLTSEIMDTEMQMVKNFPSSLSPLPLVLNSNMFEWLEKEAIKGQDIVKLQFSVFKYNPLWMTPLVWVTYRKNGKYFKRSAYLIYHCITFTAFDLTQSINSEITKVKPVLASGNLSFDLTPQGILDIKDSSQGLKLSTASYDFWRHTFIVGQSGSGKSFLLKLLIEDIFRKYQSQFSVVLLDPHASLDPLLTGITSRQLINFRDNTTNLFVNIGQPALSTELTIDLFSTVLPVHENQTLMRVLKHALQLLYSIDKMNLVTLKQLLTDSVFRKDILKLTTDVNLLQFFETEYQQLQSTKYELAVLPVINLMSELDFLTKITSSVDLVSAINNNFLVSIPLKQTDLGKTITRIIGGSIIQQVFTIMQAGLVKKKVLLVVDEISVLQTPSLVHILSEARKFGLTVVLAQQYLNQVSADILQSIFANMVNYFCFKLSRDDAEIVARNLNCEIDEYFLKNKHDPQEMLELSVKLLTDLNPRESITRLMVKDRYFTPFKGTTVKI